MDPNEVQGVQFEEDQWKSSLPSFAEEGPWIVRLLIKYSGGTVKDQRTAEYVLLGVVVVAVGISLFLFFGMNNIEKVNIEDIPIEER
jgi:hypothetical protein